MGHRPSRLTTTVDILAEIPDTWPVRPASTRSARRMFQAATVGLLAVGLLSACGVGTSSGAASATSQHSVLAVREQFTTNQHSPVVHDNEVMALASHAGRLFAATDQ